MSNLYAVDNYFTFQFNQRYFLFLVNQEDCLAATTICSTHGVSGNVFANPQASSSTTYSGMLNHLNWFLETLRRKDWRKGLRGRTELAVHLKTISTAVLAWMVIAQLHLLVNSVKSVFGCTIRLVNSPARSRREKWLKFNGNVEYAWQLVKNASGRWAAEIFKETTEEHKVLRPIERAKFTKVTQSRKKVHRVGKLVLPSLVAWRACTKIRDAPAEKRRESKV